ncbi:MAG: MoaD/ThiS family protein [Spirochaetes bacterium]|nr:MoaD/ThiS family protein [Spirochaetota bacterium]
MKVNVKVYGTLRDKFPDYIDSTGIEIELPEGATVHDLLSNLKISESQGAVVTMDYRILKNDFSIPKNAEVQVLQTVHSG